MRSICPKGKGGALVIVWRVIDAYSPDKLLEVGSQPDVNPKLEKPSLGESISTQGGVASNGSTESQLKLS